MHKQTTTWKGCLYGESGRVNTCMNHDWNTLCCVRPKKPMTAMKKWNASQHFQHRSRLQIVQTTTGFEFICFAHLYILRLPIALTLQCASVILNSSGQNGEIWAIFHFQVFNYLKSFISDLILSINVIFFEQSETGVGSTS